MNGFVGGQGLKLLRRHGRHICGQQVPIFLGHGFQPAAHDGLDHSSGQIEPAHGQGRVRRSGVGRKEHRLIQVEGIAPGLDPQRIPRRVVRQVRA